MKAKRTICCFFRDTKGQAMIELMIYVAFVALLVSFFLIRMSFVELGQIRSSIVNYTATMNSLMKDNNSDAIEHAKVLSYRPAPPLISLVEKEEDVIWEVEGGQILGGVNYIGVDVPMGELKSMLKLDRDKIKVGNKIVAISSIRKITDMLKVPMLAIK